MHNLKFYEPQSEEWLNARRKHVTGTELACLFNCGFNAPMTLMLNKISPPEVIDNIYMKIGRILEPAVLQAFQENLGINAQPFAPGKVAMITHRDCRLSASLDGVTPEGYVVEAKTFGSEDIDKAKKKFRDWQEGVPRNYLTQVHAQMMLTGTDVAYIGALSYFFPVPFIAYKVHRSEEIEDMVKRCVNHFWKCHDEDREYKLTLKARNRFKDLLEQSTEKIYEDIIRG